MTKNNNDSQTQAPQDGFAPVVFTVQQDDKTFWVLIACPEEKVQTLETAYANILHAKSETDLGAKLEEIGAEVRDYGEVEDIIENGKVVGQKIPDNIIKIASRVIGKEKDDPELTAHPENYMPGNGNSP